jgi:hypothetical protein
VNAFPLFHWSPTTRRRSIQRTGLVPSSRSVDGLWRPPYVCYADDPMLAWALSGDFHPEVDSWDLWQTWSDVPRGYERIEFDGDTDRVKEYRVYERVFKRDLRYVATRARIDSVR